jgi:hypothetical protein
MSLNESLRCKECGEQFDTIDTLMEQRSEKEENELKQTIDRLNLR